MFRPQKPLMFEPLNPEHSLVDAITTEIHSYESPEIVYWVNKKETEVAQTETGYMDDLDQVYGERSSGDARLRFREPEKIYGKIDIEPIINELTRLGLTTINSIDLYVNIGHAHNVLKQPPKGGDVFRITYLIRNTDNTLKEMFVYYKVSTVDPVDIYNYQYINYQINAEQTNMMDVPDEIKNYYIENEFK